MVTILIWLCLGIIAFSLLMMVGFGLKNAGSTLSQSKLGLFGFALPLVIFVVAYLVSGDVTSAAVMAAVWTALAGIAALLIAGAKSLFAS